MFCAYREFSVSIFVVYCHATFIVNNKSKSYSNIRYPQQKKKNQVIPSVNSRATIGT